jgi:hypothetical protein
MADSLARRFIGPRALPTYAANVITPSEETPWSMCSRSTMSTTRPRWG